MPPPSLEDLRYAIRRRTRRGRYALEDAAHATRRGARRASSEARGRWSGLTLRVRQRIVGVLAIALLVVAIAVLIVPNLPCGAPGGDQCQSADEAVALVPGDSAAYLHVDADPDTQQYEQAAALAERLPTVTEQVIARLPGPRGGSIDYRRDVAPWLGGEAALALVPAGGGDPEPTVLLEVGDQRGANRFVERLTGRDPKTESYREVELSLDGELAVTSVGGFAIAGPETSVKRVIDVEAGGGRSLEDSEPAQQVSDALPEPRLADLYLSEESAGELLAPRGPLASFEVFVNAKATVGAGAALVAKDDALELHVHSLLDPERAQNAPGFFGAFPSFEPALAGEVSESALAYLALGDPADSVEGLLAQATAEAPAIAAGFKDIGEQLRKGGEVNLEDEVLPLLTSQAAVSVEPRRGSGVGPGVPFVSLIVADVDGEEAKRALARLQAPIAKALDPGRSLQGPIFREQVLDGVPVRSLRISPSVDLSYAVVDGKLVVSTDPLGVTQVSSGESTLEGSDGFRAATEGFPDEVSALVYLNLGGLLGLAEQAGLGADPGYARFSQEFRRLEGLGVAVERGDEEIDSEIRLTVGD